MLTDEDAAGSAGYGSDSSDAPLSSRGIGLALVHTRPSDGEQSDSDDDMPLGTRPAASPSAASPSAASPTAASPKVAAEQYPESAVSQARMASAGSRPARPPSAERSSSPDFDSGSGGSSGAGKKKHFVLPKIKRWTRFPSGLLHQSAAAGLHPGCERQSRSHMQFT